MGDWVELELSCSLFPPDMVAGVIRQLADRLEVELLPAGCGAQPVRVRLKGPDSQPDAPALFRRALTQALLERGARQEPQPAAGACPTKVDITMRMTEADGEARVFLALPKSACTPVQLLRAVAAAGEHGEIILESTNPIERTTVTVRMPSWRLQPFCMTLLDSLPPGTGSRSA